MFRKLIPVFMLVSLTVASADAGFLDRGLKGDGDLITTDLDLDAIEAVHLECGLDIDIAFGKQQKVALTMDGNLVEHFELDVRGGVLTVATDRSTRPSRKARLALTLRSLDRLEINGAGDVRIDDFAGDDLVIEIDGAGDIEASGKVENLVIDVDGAGDVSADRLEARHAKVSVDGAGDVEVFAHQSCNVTINGVGDVDVHGKPDRFDQRVNGIGRVSRK